jgi:tetratricopeptide (TPR) repeat protein
MISGAGIQLAICLGMFFCREAALSDPNSKTAVLSQSEALRQQVELQRVSAIEPNQPGRVKAMQNVITQLESLQWSGDNPSSVLPSEVKKSQDNKTTPAAKPTVPVSQPVSAKGQPAGVPQVHGLDTVENPIDVLAVADALYKAEDYKRAGRFYQMAIESKSKEPAVVQWAMYQTANCLRRHTPDQAVQWYDRLLAEYPGSPWVAAALAQRKSLDWLKQNQTLLLEKKITSNDPNQQ